MANLNTYNPSDVYLIICGYQCEGWKEITIEKTTPAFKQIKGIRRKNTRVLDGDSSAKITITVMQTCELNDLLSEIHIEDIEKGTGRLEITLVDKSGTSLSHSIEAYILNFPNKTYSDSIEFLPWEIQCQSMQDHFIGGNTQPSASVLADALKKLGIN